MLKEIRTSLVLLIVMIIITGVAYPALITGIAKTIFSAQASGSFIQKDGKIIGSALIGQQFTKAGYFHPRPSLAGNGYEAMSSAASNLSPTSKKLEDDIAARQEALALENPGKPIPVDLLTASASGLDPHISVEAANFQVPRIAKARKQDEAAIIKIIEQNIEEPTFVIFGERRVNVLMLNMDLDK